MKVKEETEWQKYDGKSSDHTMWRNKIQTTERQRVKARRNEKSKRKKKKKKSSHTFTLSYPFISLSPNVSH